MADMFANARAYEARMGRWSARLAPLFAHFANITDGGRVLDVGCGTGALVRTVAAMTRHSAIVGIDPAEPFLAYARAQLADPRITFDRGTKDEYEAAGNPIVSMDTKKKSCSATSIAMAICILWKSYGPMITIQKLC